MQIGDKSPHAPTFGDCRPLMEPGSYKSEIIGIYDRFYRARFTFPGGMSFVESFMLRH